MRRFKASHSRSTSSASFINLQMTLSFELLTERAQRSNLFDGLSRSRMSMFLFRNLLFDSSFLPFGLYFYILRKRSNVILKCCLFEVRVTSSHRGGWWREQRACLTKFQTRFELFQLWNWSRRIYILKVFFISFHLSRLLFVCFLLSKVEKIAFNLKMTCCFFSSSSLHSNFDFLNWVHNERQ